MVKSRFLGTSIFNCCSSTQHPLSCSCIAPASAPPCCILRPHEVPLALPVSMFRGGWSFRLGPALEVKGWVSQLSLSLEWVVHTEEVAA